MLLVRVSITSIHLPPTLWFRSFPLFRILLLQEHSRGGRHINANWSPIFEDLYSPELGHRVPSILLDNGSALNICPLATTIALDYASSDFGPFTQTVKAYDSTKRKVIGTLEIELLIGRPYIHRVGVIPSSLHQMVLVNSCRKVLG
ncbi:hypothetical protein CK203_007618 [Vitis vinifera]|uniref:Uncharacterized protein n=1 Tax=Vitis vinifera TaxID=29760 RepID=A0A438G1N3_VITVI|nr:hypothetical protein CK203_007618 [Vitis vinifera]